MQKFIVSCQFLRKTFMIQLWIIQQYLRDVPPQSFASWCRNNSINFLNTKDNVVEGVPLPKNQKVRVSRPEIVVKLNAE